MMSLNIGLLAKTKIQTFNQEHLTMIMSHLNDSDQLRHYTSREQKRYLESYAWFAISQFFLCMCAISRAPTMYT